MLKSTLLHRGILASLSALSLAACAVGPDYVAPAPPAAASGPFLSAGNPSFAQQPVSKDWWRLYKDPVLDGLIADALASNTDLRVALANIQKARAGLRGSRAGRLPETSIGASGGYERLPESQRLPGAPAESWTVDAGVQVGYELDLFGRVSRDVAAASADLDAARADAEAVRIVVVADTTQAYADAASGAARLAVAHKIVDLLDRSLAVTQKRHEAGLATGLDIAQIATLRDQRAAEIPQIEAEREAALFRLATLTGRPPASLPPIAAERTVSLEILQPIPVGDGASLLARRPDVQAAERRLAAATSRIGVATADLYPRITLGGSFGSTGTGIGDLFGAGPLRWLIGPLLSWSFPNQEPIRARIAAAQADTQARLAQFDGKVLGALEETEVALSRYTHSLEQRRSLQSARDQAKRAADITQAQLREGTVDSLRLLDAQRTYAEAEAALAQQDADVSRRQIDVFRALAGGWT